MSKGYGGSVDWQERAESRYETILKLNERMIELEEQLAEYKLFKAYERISEMEAQLAEQKEACEGLMIIANKRNGELEAQLDTQKDEYEELIDVAESNYKKLEAQLKMPEDNRWYLEVVTIRRRNDELESQLAEFVWVEGHPEEYVSEVSRLQAKVNELEKQLAIERADFKKVSASYVRAEKQLATVLDDSEMVRGILYDMDSRIKATIKGESHE